MQRIMSAMSKGKKRSFDKIVTKSVPRQKLEKPLLGDQRLEPGSIRFYDEETKSVWDYVTHTKDTLEELRDAFGLRMSPSEIENIKTHYPAGDKPKQVNFLLQKWALNRPGGTPTIHTLLESLWFADREATVKDICTMLRSTEESATRKGGIIAAKLSMEAQGDICIPTTCTSPSGELVGTSPIATESLASGMLVHGTMVQRQESSKSNDHFTAGPVPFHTNAPASVLAAPIQDSESGNIDQLVRAHREHEEKLLVVVQQVARLETERDEAGKREDEDRVRHSEKEKDLQARIEKLECLKREQSQGVQSLNKPTAGACLEGVDSGSSNDNIYEKIDSPPSTKRNAPPLPPRWKQGTLHHSTPTLEAWTESPPLPPRNPHTLKSKQRSFPIYTQPSNTRHFLLPLPQPGSVPHQYQPLFQHKSIYHDPLHRSSSDPVFQSDYEVPTTQNDDEEDEGEGLTLFLNHSHRRSESEKSKRDSRRSVRREPTPDNAIDRRLKLENRLAEQK